MTSDANALDIDKKDAGAGQSPPRALARLERLLVATGDRLNPILVKETRQALKSRQFVLTFTLLLLAGWIWSLLGVALVGPQIYYGTHGPTMFMGYFTILSFPLLVVVPFSAFRSLAAEQEERTYEMLSITALSPRQIILGKLGSAVLQMLVYLSAITPCLAFTYMLRGLSLPTILLIVCYVAVASLSLSMICLFLGTLTTEKYVQVLVSVLVAVGLFIMFWIGLMSATGILYSGDRTFRDSDFWITNAVFASFVAGYFALVFEAAAARITFASDNRSTRLRAVMLFQFILLTGWMTYAWICSHGSPIPVMVFAVLAAVHWYVMGAMMTGESPELSLRVRRQLPRSTLGRVFLTWFNPGPGTGYIFALAGMLGSLLLVIIGLSLIMFLPNSPWQPPRWTESAFWFALLAVCYATFFLGLGVLLIRALRRRLPVSIPAAVLLQAVLVLAFSGIPAIIHWMSDYRNQDYSIIQIMSPLWTLIKVLDQVPSAELEFLATIVPAAALVVLVANVPGIVRELRFVRIAAPQRVAEEEAALAAQKSPPLPTRRNPWDD